MALAENIRNGKAAVEYVKGLNIRANNKVQDRIAAAGGIENVIAVGGNDYTADDGVDLTRRLSRLVGKNLESSARITIQTRYGNCEEQAIIALVFLLQKGIRPLDLVTFTAAGYDHVWAIIGLARNADMSNLRSWGADAVWVDPWQSDGIAFAVDDLVKGKVRNLNAIYKCHTAAYVEAGNPASIFRAS